MKKVIVYDEQILYMAVCAKSNMEHRDVDAYMCRYFESNYKWRIANQTTGPWKKQPHKCHKYPDRRHWLMVLDR